MPGDEIWDEHQWEAFFRENDRRVDRYMDLLFSFMGENPPPAPEDETARQAWERDLRAFLDANGFTSDVTRVPFLRPDEEAPEAFDEEALAFDEEAGDEPDDPFGDLGTLPIYRQAFDLATEVLDWSHTLPGAMKDSTLVQLCSHLMQIPADVAKGHGIGYEQDMIGGNIACVKRALADANAALDLLAESRDAPYMEGRRYARFYEAVFELRNALGIYVQDLRDRFDLGVD